MVALSNRFKAWNVLAIGLNVRRLWSCRLLLSYPCLCQGSPVHLTFIMQENICTYLKIHQYRRYWKSIYSGSLSYGWVCRGCLQMHISFLRKKKKKKKKRFLSACASVTNLDLAGAGKTASTAAGSEATAARAVLPGPTSLSSGFTPETPRPARIRLLFGNLAFCKHEKSGSRFCAITLHRCLVYLTRKSER